MDRKTFIACLGALAAGGCSRRPRISVGSKNFTEQLVVGELLAQQIERRMNDVQVERVFNVSGTMLAHEALVGGDIDLYPEYTGTALTAVLKRPAVNDPKIALDWIREAYRDRWGLEWLKPLGFEDTFAMIVRGETARNEHLKSLSDAAATHPWRLGCGYEFKHRPDGLDGLVKRYGLRVQGEPATMDLGLLYAALTANKVDLIAANSTDGIAAALDVVTLEDNLRFFPPYECVVVARADTLARYPRLRPVLEELSGKLTADVVRKLNYEVDGKHRMPADVAADFLKSH